MIKQGPPSFRCGTCNINWPYSVEFRECRSCGAALTGMRLAPSDEVLSWAEALELAGDDEPTPRTQARRKSRQPTEQELAEFHAALDYWAEATGPDDPALG